MQSYWSSSDPEAALRQESHVFWSHAATSFKEGRSPDMKTAIHTPFRLAALSGAAFLTIASATPAFAQDNEAPRGHIVTLGIGPQAVPQYPGADSYTIAPFLIG